MKYFDFSKIIPSTQYVIFFHYEKIIFASCWKVEAKLLVHILSVRRFFQKYSVSFFDRDFQPYLFFLYAAIIL